MAVDTYLRNKNTSRYQTVQQEDVQFLVAPTLALNAKRLHVGLKKFLLWRSWSIQIEPVSDHLHSLA